MILTDKVAIVTGAGGGIGREISLKFADQGAFVVVSDLRQDNAQRVADEIAANNGRAMAAKCDVTVPPDVAALVDTAVKTFGGIDILVNNAGGSADLLNKLSDFSDSPEEVWTWVIDLNLHGTMRCTQAVLKPMIARNYGRIINIASIAAEVGICQRADYAAAKAGVIAFSKTIAMEAGCCGITVNSISPGLVKRIRPREDGTFETATPDYTEGNYLKRFGMPQDIAATALFLASDEAAYITGQNITVDGGRTLGPKAGSLHP